LSLIEAKRNDNFLAKLTNETKTGIFLENAVNYDLELEQKAEEELLALKVACSVVYLHALGTFCRH
jgi:hypothetical protein